MGTKRKDRDRASGDQPKAHKARKRKSKRARAGQTPKGRPGITEQKLVKRQLRYMADLLAHVNDAIIASDASYRLTAWNRAAETMYGWKAEEVLGRNGLDVIQTVFPETEKEHMILMPGASLAITQERAHLLHAYVQGLRVLYENVEVQITVSVGVAAFPLHGETGEEVLIHADRALYQAKRDRRNQMVVYADSIEPAVIQNMRRM